MDPAAKPQDDIVFAKISFIITRSIPEFTPALDAGQGHF